MTSAPLLSIQLYSGRNFPPLDSQLAVVRGAGFTTVETFGAHDADIDETLRPFKHHGVSARSGHVDLAMAEKAPDTVFAVARALDLAFVVVPYLLPQERPADRAGWVAIGQRLAAIGERFGREGLRVAWHDVGTGVLPWADLWPLCLAAGAEVMIAEHDNPSDFGRFARASAAAMRRYPERSVR